MIERYLTEAERTAISRCLRKEAESYDLRVEALLAGKIEGEEDGKALIDAALDRARSLNKTSCGLLSLAAMIERSDVVAKTVIHYPETL